MSFDIFFFNVDVFFNYCVINKFHTWKYPFLIFVIHIDLTGKKQVA